MTCLMLNVNYTCDVTRDPVFHTLIYSVKAVQRSFLGWEGVADMANKQMVLKKFRLFALR